MTVDTAHAAGDPFARRAARARELSDAWPFAKDMLAFFAEVFALQSESWRSITPGKAASLTPQAEVVRPFASALVDLVGERGPLVLAARARQLEAWDVSRWMSLLEAPAPGTEAETFFRTVLLQPWTRARVAAATSSGTTGGSTTCPSCGALPIASVLFEDVEAGAVRRRLACSLCGLEWSFPRVACVSCREEDPGKLPRFSADELPWLRVEACDSCGLYLKGVDLAKEPRAEPTVDELASTPLDVVATERGYAKVTPNLAGA